MEIEVLDYRLYMAVHVDVCEYSERITTSLVYPCKKHDVKQRHMLNSNSVVQKLSATAHKNLT
jgi:hypothetical protein